MIAAVFFDSFLRALSMVPVQMLPMRHVLDVMHIVKNIAESNLKFLFGDKDTPESRRDLHHMGVRRELWLRPRGNGQMFVKPHTPYVLTNEERKMFIEEVSAIRTPTGYGSVFSKHLCKLKYSRLKSHNYHCLFQQIILVLSRTLLHPFERISLIRLGKCLNRICARVVDKSELNVFRLYVAETMCYLEVCFPPSFLTSCSTPLSIWWMRSNCVVRLVAAGCTHANVILVH